MSSLPELPPESEDELLVLSPTSSSVSTCTSELHAHSWRSPSEVMDLFSNLTLHAGKEPTPVSFGMPEDRNLFQFGGSNPLVFEFGATPKKKSAGLSSGKKKGKLPDSLTFKGGGVSIEDSPAFKSAFSSNECLHDDVNHSSPTTAAYGRCKIMSARAR